MCMHRLRCGCGCWCGCACGRGCWSPCVRGGGCGVARAGAVAGARAVAVALAVAVAVARAGAVVGARAVAVRAYSMPMPGHCCGTLEFVLLCRVLAPTAVSVGVWFEHVRLLQLPFAPYDILTPSLAFSDVP